MRSLIYGLVCFVLFCSNAFASCGSEQATCSSTCFVSAAITKRFGGGNECINNCLTEANACEAREAQQQQMEQQRQQAQQQQRQQAAERQAQQAREVKEIAGKQHAVQQAGEIAQQVGAEAATQQQFDTALEKGMQALDQKGYITAEYQFKAALKIKPNNMDAKAGLLHAILGAGKRAAALTYAKDQLLALAAKPPGADGRSAYANWLEVLGDNGLANDAEREQLGRIYPFGGGDPERAAAAFPKTNPKSAFLSFARQIGGAMPAIRADYEDRRKEESAQREKDEDAQWQKAQKAATHTAMQAYMTRYPNGRYVAQAREKDEEYQRVPLRPQIPVAVNEDIWRTIEASEAYRNTPRPRTIKVSDHSSIQMEYTGSKTSSLPKPAASRHENIKEVTPLGDKCSEHRNSLTIDGKTYGGNGYYACGSFLSLGGTADGKTNGFIKSIDELKGSLFPMRVGARLSVRTQQAYVPDRKFDSAHASSCEVVSQGSASELDPRLTGTAWKIHCQSSYTSNYDNKVNATETDNYYIEDIGVMLSDIGVLDMSKKKFVLPSPGTQTVMNVEGEYGSRYTTTYQSYKWTVGE